MARLHSTIFTMAWVVIGGVSLPVSADPSGTAKIVQGAVRVERDGAFLPLRVGDTLQEKDRVVVPAGGAAGITLRDDTRISLGSGATLVLEQFKLSLIHI